MEQTCSVTCAFNLVKCVVASHAYLWHIPPSKSTLSSLFPVVDFTKDSPTDAMAPSLCPLPRLLLCLSCPLGARFCTRPAPRLCSLPFQMLPRFLLSPFSLFLIERTPLPQPPGPEVCTTVTLAEWLCFPVCGSEVNTARLQPVEARVQRQTAPSSDSPPCEVGVGVAAGIRSQYLPGPTEGHASTLGRLRRAHVPVVHRCVC